jgi:integrase
MQYSKVKTVDELLIGDHRLIQSNIIEYLVSLQQISHGTRYLYAAVIRHFYDINDILLNWKKINAFLGQNNKVVNDRAYIKQEIATLLEKSNERMKVVVLLLATTGMRIGAIPPLKIRNLKKVEEYGLYQITVYEKAKEQYTTFCTPECTKNIDSYLECRRRYGETISPNTPLIRDEFDRNDILHIKRPRHISVKTLTRLLDNLLVASGIRKREPLLEGQQTPLIRRKDAMLTHAFRKYVNTAMIRADLKSLNKELLLGHKSTIGLENSYYRPDDSELLQDYLKAVDLLTISEENRLKMENIKIKQRNDALEKDKDEVIALRKELEPLLALKNTLIKEGLLKES